MGPSFHVATLLGIQLRVHWTFLLLLGWLFLAPLMSGGENAWAAGLRSVVFILAVFACVVLHEFGHALAARTFGIGTRDVTLLPIGGVARLERMPEQPWQELIVALAGPAVNVAIAAVLLPAALLVESPRAFDDPQSMDWHRTHFLAALASVNVLLVLFNLLPAFPMDGGRVLRAVLAMAMDRVRATRIAAGVGQVVAVGFALVGLLGGNLFLLLIALFVFLGAAAETQMTAAAEHLRGLRVADAMVRRFRVLYDTDTLQAAAGELLAGSQQDFPVLRNGAAADDADALIGVLTRGALVRALASSGLAARVSDCVSRPCAFVAPDDPLERATELLRGVGSPATPAQRPDEGTLACPLVPVAQRGPDGRTRLLGVVTPENVTELIAVRSALRGDSSTWRELHNL